MDEKFPPKYRVVMHTEQEIPPDLLCDLLLKTFSIERLSSQLLALSILRHKAVSYGAYSREIAEAKAFTINQAILKHGRMLNTVIEPCISEQVQQRQI